MDEIKEKLRKYGYSADIVDQVIGMAKHSKKPGLPQDYIRLLRCRPDGIDLIEQCIPIANIEDIKKQFGHLHLQEWIEIPNNI